MGLNSMPISPYSGIFLLVGCISKVGLNKKDSGEAEADAWTISCNIPI